MDIPALTVEAFRLIYMYRGHMSVWEEARKQRHKEGKDESDNSKRVLEERWKALKPHLAFRYPTTLKSPKGLQWHIPSS